MGCWKGDRRGKGSYAINKSLALYPGACATRVFYDSFPAVRGQNIVKVKFYYIHALLEKTNDWDPNKVIKDIVTNL